MSTQKIIGYYTRPTTENDKTVIRDYAKDSQGTWYTRTPESNISKAWRKLTGEYPEQHDNGDIYLYLEDSGNNVKLSYVAKTVQLPTPALVSDTQEQPIKANMTEAEAREKHAQLKSLYSVTRSLLLEMKDRKGYLALGFETFEDYGEVEWGYKKTYLYGLAKAEEVQKSLNSAIAEKEIPESQLRELAKIPESLRSEIYQQAKAEAEAQNKEITAKLIKEKAEAESLKTQAEVALYNTELALKSELKHFENLYQHQSEDNNKAVNAHCALVNEFNELEASIDTKAAEIAEEKTAQIQQKMQSELDKTIATVEADYQAKIDSQKDKISSLENTIVKIKQTSATTEQDTTYLADLKQEIDEAKAALKQLSLDEKQASDAKRANHFYIGVAKALSSDVHDHIANINANVRLDGHGNAYPMCPLTDNSKDYLKQVTRVLHNAALFLENLTDDQTPL